VNKCEVHATFVHSEDRTVAMQVIAALPVVEVKCCQKTILGTDLRCRWNNCCYKQSKSADCNPAEDQGEQ